MIDPSNVTKYDLTHGEKEEFLLFACAVTGRVAQNIAFCLDYLLSIENEKRVREPFEQIIYLSDKDKLLQSIKEAKLGKYNRLPKLYYDLATSGVNLHTCWVENLEQFHGIGPKIARYFLLHTRNPDKMPEQIASIDTHIKQWLKEKGYYCRNYKEAEQAFLREAQKTGRDPATLDLEIWNERSIKLNK